MMKSLKMNKLEFKPIPNRAKWYSAKYLELNCEYLIFEGEFYKIYFKENDKEMVLIEEELENPVKICEDHLKRYRDYNQTYIERDSAGKVDRETIDNMFSEEHPLSGN